MTKQLNKKGTSLVELIAVIIIMGIIAGIAIPTTIAVINRQKKNAAKSSAQNVYSAAQTALLEAATGESVTGVTEYSESGEVKGYDVTSKALVDAGELEKDPFTTTNNVGVTFRLLLSNNKVTPQGTTFTVNGVTLTWDSTKNEFTTATSGTTPAPTTTTAA
ncbi:MAG: prepilin-type N-terminal cleavage/methylation domain-containing protein [bacterium]|nr:prepilin-type N-terminal cleavage/methylation domain-containing protein [bacterium]